MTPQVAIHLVAALAAFGLGAVMHWRAKGTPSHRAIGRVWVALMLVTAISSLWIPRFLTFSWIHILTGAALLALVNAMLAIRAGNVERHRRSMIGAYVGLCGAFVGALVPGRLVGTFVRGLFAG